MWSLIAADNETAADGVLDRIEGILRMLGEHPEAGRNRDEVSAGLRSFPVGNSVLFYRLQSDRLILVRVLSYGQDIEGAAFQ